MTWNNYFQKRLRYVLCKVVRGYQLSFAALLGGQCRFYPSCSEYALDVLHGHSLGQGLKLIAKRVLSCHPFHPGGYDPAPKVQ